MKMVSPNFDDTRSAMLTITRTAEILNTYEEED